MTCVRMNVLLTPYAREEIIPEPLLAGLRTFNSNDGFVRAAGEQLNFAAQSEDEAEYPSAAFLKKGKVSRQDPMSHRIIEKRRRDRMNNCLADLSRLIPQEYMKKGRGRVEKTEIIEMAIRHLKYLQERANAADHQSEDTFRAGYQEAVGEAVRFLVEVQGLDPGDRLCISLASHLQRRIEGVTKRETLPREHLRHTGGNSSETPSSSSSSQGFQRNPSVIAQMPQTAPPSYAEAYDTLPESYSMDCDGVPVAQIPVSAEGESLSREPLPLDGRRKRSPASLRTVRKPEHAEDYLQSYKFKNSIERRFSRSQDSETTSELPRAAHPPAKVYSHKRRRAARPALPAPPSGSTCTSTSASTEEGRDTSPQDTSSDSAHHHLYDKPTLPTQYVPIFALNAHGKYYVPLSVEYSCLSRHLGPFDVLDGRAAHLPAPLHPVTIHVNFQPCLNYSQVKREPSERDWHPV